MSNIQNLESDLSAASESGLAFWPVFLFPSTSPPFFIFIFIFGMIPVQKSAVMP